MAEAHLALCPAGTAIPSPVGLRLPDGRTLNVHGRQADVPAACASTAIGIEADAVRSLALSPVGVTTEIQAIVTISPSGASFPSSVEIFGPGAADALMVLPALPVASPLLPMLAVRSFGVEERAHVTRTGEGLEIVCVPGAKPAGILLDPGDFRMPRGLSASLVAEGRGAQGFGLALVRPGEDASDKSTPLRQAERGLRAVLAAGEWPRTDGALRFVVSCPAAAARISLTSLAIEPEGELAAAVQRAAWMWEIERWQDAPDQLLTEAAGRQIDRLFVALDIAGNEVRHAERLADFVRRARERGIAVTAVEGDPAMALPHGRSAALRRARAIAVYQATAPASAALAGVQYDIEPYLLPEFYRDRVSILSGWAQTIQALAAALGEPIDLVLPFWIADQRDARERLLEPARESVGTITVMAYRTTAEAVTTVSEPLLAWGAAHDIMVRIGLETGPVPDEVHRRYVPAREGDLHLVSVGDVTAALLLREPEPGPQGVTFLLRMETIVPGSRVSFLKDEKEMLAVAGRARVALTAWRSFGGFAFHGLLGN